MAGRKRFTEIVSPTFDDITVNPEGTPIQAPEALLPRQVSLPASWYMGAHGDPIARFDYLVLELHDDGTVTWRSDEPTKEGE